jgi:hypothetical protein
MSTKMPRSAVIALLTAAAMALIFVVTLITYQQANTANHASGGAPVTVNCTGSGCGAGAP